MFSFDPSFDGPLVPPPDDWPVFDSVVMCTLSPFSSSSSSTTPSPSVPSDLLPPAFPSSAALAAMPIPPSRSSPRNKNPGHIPRPRNAFMLFRSAFAAAQKIGANIEHDNRHITRIIAHCWNHLSDAEKQVWRDKAAVEKAQHAERYPDYRFSPVGRAKKPKKRKVRRNGVEDVKRCETLAELVMAGNCGLALESALMKIQQERDFEERHVGTEMDVFTSTEKRRTLFDRDPPLPDSETGDVPPFRSPLLPPVKTTPQQVPDKNFTPEPLVITSARYAEPQTQTFYFPTETSTSDDDLESLLSPCYQYYQPNLRNVVPSPRSIPPTHYQSAMGFVQSGHAEPEQSVPDFTLYSWNQSDSFSYYH